jgi:hypothetical protein
LPEACRTQQEARDDLIAGVWEAVYEKTQAIRRHCTKASMRAPSLLPYVLPVARAGIATAEAQAFSCAVLALNKVFFESLRPTLTLADGDQAFQRLMQAQGFTPTTSLPTLIARWQACLSPRASGM